MCGRMPHACLMSAADSASRMLVPFVVQVEGGKQWVFEAVGRWHARATSCSVLVAPGCLAAGGANPNHGIVYAGIGSQCSAAMHHRVCQ
jgi:hypothetical protein